jgi:hypothetical protein
MSEVLFVGLDVHADTITVAQWQKLEGRFTHTV